MKTFMKKKLLNVKQCASYLNCSYSTIRKLLREGKLPHLRIGNKIYFKKESIDNWVNKNEQQ